MPPKKNVYGDSSSSKTSKASSSKSSTYSKTQIATELAALKSTFGHDYINKQLTKYKFASDAQMTKFIKSMKKKTPPRSSVDIQGDIDMERERLGAGVVNSMLKDAGFLTDMEMEDLLAKMRKIKPPKKTEVRAEERVNYNSAHETLTKIAENSSSEDFRSTAKAVDEELSLAQIERNKIDKINGEIRSGIETFRNMMTIRGDFDPSKNVRIALRIDDITGVLARLNASFTELSGKPLTFAEIPFDSILGALTASFESAKKVVEAANTYSADLSTAVQSKIVSEQGRATADASFTELENFIYGNMPRSISESQKDYDSRLGEIKKILLQKQEQFNSNTGLLTTANEKIRSLSHDLDDARSALTTGAGNYNQLKSEYDNIQNGVALLNNELSYLRAARTSFANLCEKFHVEFDKLAPLIEQTLVDLESRRNSVQTELTNSEGKHKEEITKLNDTIIGLENKISELQEHLDVAEDNHRQIVQEHVDKYDSFKSRSDERIRKLKGTIADLKQQRDSAQSELKKTKDQLSAINNELKLKTTEIETLNSSIESLKKAQNDAVSNNSKAKALVETYKAENETLSKKLQIETENVVKANSLLNSQAEDFKKREEAMLQEHQKKLDELDETIKATEKKYRVALQLIKTRDSSIEKLTDEKAKLLTQLEETERKAGDLATSSMSAEKVRQTLDVAADTISQQNQAIEGMKFLWDGLIHPKAEFHGKAQIIGSQGELERISNLAKRYRMAYEKVKKDNANLEARFKARGDLISHLQEELQALKTRSNQQHQGLNPEARAHLQLVAEAANPNGQAAKIIEAGQSLMAASQLIIPGDDHVIPPAKAARLTIPAAPSGGNGDDGGDWLFGLGELFGGFFGGGRVAGALPGGDPDIDMDEEGFLGPDDRNIERVRVRVWRSLGYRSEVSSAKKAKRNERSNFTSSRFVGGFIVGHAPDWNLQPNQLIFDFWNNYYNSSKPFDL